LEVGGLEGVSIGSLIQAMRQMGWWLLVAAAAGSVGSGLGSYGSRLRRRNRGVPGQPDPGLPWFWSRAGGERLHRPEIPAVLLILAGAFAFSYRDRRSSGGSGI